jgi:hypothetical protein
MVKVPELWIYTPPPAQVPPTLLPDMVPPFIINVPPYTNTPPPWWEVVLPIMLDPVFIIKVPPVLGSTTALLLLLRPCKVILLSRIKVTPDCTENIAPLDERLSVRFELMPLKVMVMLLLPLKDKVWGAIFSLALISIV